MARDREYNLQLSLCRFIDIYCPQAYYRSDLGGVRLNMSQAIKVKHTQKHRGHPDFAIFHPSGKYDVLFLELKDKQTDVFLKKGGLPKGNAIHLIEQAAMVLMLRQKGYAADIVIGLPEAQIMVAEYLQFPEVFDPKKHYTNNVRKIIEEATDEQIRQAQLGHPVVFDFIKREV